MTKEIMVVTWDPIELILEDLSRDYFGDYSRRRDLEDEIKRGKNSYDNGEPLKIKSMQGDNFTFVVDGYHAIRHFRDGVKEHLDGVLYAHVSVPTTEVTLDEDLQRNTFFDPYRLLNGATSIALENSRFIAPSVARYMRSQGFREPFVWYNHQTILFNHEEEQVKALNIKWIRNAAEAIKEVIQ